MANPLERYRHDIARTFRRLHITLLECSMAIHKHDRKPGYPEKVVKDKDGILRWKWFDSTGGRI